MTNEPKIGVEKKLKRTKFDAFDTAVSIAMFILLQIVVVMLYKMLPENVQEMGFVLVIAQLLIEGTFFLSVLVTAKTRDVEWVQATGIKSKFDYKVVILGAVVAAIALICFSKWSDLFIYFLQSIGFKYKSSSVDVSNFFMYLVALVVHCGVPAFAEEMLFRGVVCSGLKKLNKHLAVFLSAFLFMIMHGTPLQTVHQLILGIIYGYIFVYSNNIWISIFAHFLNNGITVTLYYISTLLYPSSVIPDGTIISFEPVSNNVLWLNIASAVVLTIIGVICMVFVMRAIKKYYQESQTSDNAENQFDEQDENQTNNRQNIWTIVLYSIIGMYLVGEWILSLINGFYL